MEAEGQENTLDRFEQTNLEESLYIHSLVRKGLSDGGLSHMLMSFARELAIDVGTDNRIRRSA